MAKPPLYCSFCGKTDREVTHMVAGPTVFICNECVRLCQDIIDAGMAHQGETDGLYHEVCQSKRRTTMKLSDVKEGDRLIADGGFTCMREGQIGNVLRTEDGDLAIPCDSGHHCLDGQVDYEDGVTDGEVIGLKQAPEYDG